MTRRWSVFVDESGRFEPDDTSFVVGLVVDGPPDAYRAARLRRRLEAIWGPGPWPPHAAHLRFPAARVVYALRTFEPEMPAGALGADGKAAVRELVRALRAGPMAARAEEIASGAFPTHDDCRQADALLRGHRAWPTLRAIGDQQDRAMGTLVAEVLAAGNGFLVGARADAEPAGPPPTAPLELREDAYVRALGAMAERVARLAGEHEVEWLVLTRTVEVAPYGKTDLGAGVLQRMLDAASTRAGSPARMRATGKTWAYREHRPPGPAFHPMLVLADWVASGVRRALIGRRSNYAGLAQALETAFIPRVGLVLRPAARAGEAGALPTVGAAGREEDAIRAAFAGSHEDLLGSGWAWDQARMWAAAARVWP